MKTDLQAFLNAKSGKYTVKPPIVQNSKPTLSPFEQVFGNDKTVRGSITSLGQA